MSPYEQVDKSIWSDPDFEALTLEAAALYLWSFTNLRCNSAGLYKVSLRGIEESKVPAKKLVATLAELAEANLLRFEDGVLWVRTRVKHLGHGGSKRAAGIGHDVAKISPTHPLREAFLTKYAEGDSAYEWLAPFLRDLKRAPNDIGSDTVLGDETGKPEGVSQQDIPSHSVVLFSAVKEEPPTATDDLGFGDWLSHHATTTGMQPPKAKTKARANVAAMFRQRRQEDYSLEDLKLATVGAFNDDFRRERGYFGLVSILGPKNVHDLVEKGKRSRLKLIGGQQFQYRCRDCRLDITEAQYRNDAGRCPEHYQQFVRKTLGDDAA